VVEHLIGNEEVVSSILAGSTGIYVADETSILCGIGSKALSSEVEQFYHELSAARELVGSPICLSGCCFPGPPYRVLAELVGGLINLIE
jgi:hypothetical protein